MTNIGIKPTGKQKTLVRIVSACVSDDGRICVAWFSEDVSHDCRICVASHPQLFPDDLRSRHT